MDIKPFIVRYKAGKDKSIQPDIHGRFATREQAQAAAAKCSDHFGGGTKDEKGFYVGRAIVAIVVDEDALKAQEEGREEDYIPADIPPDKEESEIERLRAENRALQELLEKETCAAK